MADMNTSDRLRQIIIDQTGLEADEVTEHALLTDDLGMDWLDLFQLQMACEDEFGIQISDEDEAGIGTFGEMVDLIEAKLAQTTA